MRDSPSPATRTSDHALNRAIAATWERRQQIASQRAVTYSDSWACDNIQAPRLGAILRLLGIARDWTSEELRLILLASLADVKLTRWGGPYQEDTALDECCYLDALVEFIRRYQAQPEVERRQSG